MNNSTLSSIRKWKIYLSELMITWEFEDGDSNVVADPMSRLCKDLTPANPEALLLAAMPELIDIPPKAYEAIHQVHSETAGHHGVDRTVENCYDGAKTVTSIHGLSSDNMLNNSSGHALVVKRCRY